MSEPIRCTWRFFKYEGWSPREPDIDFPDEIEMVEAAAYDKLAARLAEAEKALQFYADSDNYGEVYEDDEGDTQRLLGREDVCFDEHSEHFGHAGKRAREYFQKHGEKGLKT